MSDHEHRDEIDNSTLTPKFVIKAGTVAGGIITAVVTIVLYIGGIKADLQSYRDTSFAARHELELRIVESEKQIDRLRTHSEQTDHIVEQIERKLDVAVSILERIDKKVNHE
jgi:hypothetical protein